MFRINLKFALRNLLRFKTYTILNILGLSIGLALGIFVILYVNYGYGYDSIHANRDRMYKLLAFIKQGEDKSFTSHLHSALLGDALKQEVSEIEDYNKVVYTSLFFKKDDSPITEMGIYADDNFFSFFNFPIIHGNSNSLLKDPNGIVLSDRLAQKLFGEKTAIGQSVSVLLNNKPTAFKINGIFKDVEHSSIRFEFVLPISLYLKDNPWVNNIKELCCEYIFTLKPNTDYTQVNNKIKNYLDGKDDTSIKDLFMQPLKELNLYYYHNGIRQMNRLLLILILSIIGGLILTISAFNFINMAIAIGIKRYREAGIKKILGSSRVHLIIQFLTESVIICLIALFFAFILLETFLPLYNPIDQVKLNIDYSDLGQMLLFIGFAIIVGIIASLYPAILLASTSPIKILKGITGSKHRIGVSRQGLIVFQFTVTIILLVGLFVFNRQSKYVETRDIGLDRQNVIFFSASNDITKHKSAFHSELTTIPEVTSISWNNQIPIRIYTSSTNILWEGKQANEKMDFWIMDTDSAFMTTFKPKLADGRFFSPAIVTDSNTYIINEEAARNMHLTDPLGKTITVNNRVGSIIGVVKNFNSLQLMAPYLPVIIRYNPAEANMVFIRYRGNRDLIQKKTEAIYKKYEAYIPFEPKLLDEAYHDLNRFADNSYKILSVLSIMAIFLACMGLFGLASFTIETRTKEIGVRKANGASTFILLRMFLKTYNKWIIIASCIGLPIAFFAWNMLLQTFFIFRPNYPLWALAVTPLIVIVIAWSTVIWQAWRAAGKNPVEALRYE